MKQFLKRNVIILTYILICVFLIVMEQVACIGFNPRSLIRCGYTEGIFIELLLMPAQLIFEYFISANPQIIYYPFLSITVHADFYLKVITFILNTTFFYLTIQSVKAIIKRNEGKKE